MNLSVFSTFMKAIGPEGRIKIARRAKVSQGFIYHLLSGYRGASAQTALDIEKASHDMASKSKTPLPVVHCWDISEACSRCPHAAKVRESTSK